MRDGDAMELGADELRVQLAAMTAMQEIATRFIQDGDLDALLSAVTDTARMIAATDMACLHLCEADGNMRLAVQRGFGDAGPELPATASSVDDKGHSVRRIPLRTQTGEIVGMLSTYARGDTSDGVHDTRLLERLARQCADAIARARWAAECAHKATVENAERIRASQALFQTTVENLPGCLAIYDREGRILYANAALQEFLAAHYPDPAQAIGSPASERMPAATWAALEAAIDRALTTGERVSYELSSELPSGRMVRQWVVAPLPADGDEPRLLAMSHDITAQRLLLDDLRESDRRKSEFIAVLSHELRNPLAAIRAGLFALEHDPTGADLNSVRRIINRQLGYLVRLVDDLLDITRVTQNKIQLERERLELGQLVRDALADNQAHLDRGGAQLTVQVAPTPVWIDADRTRLAQVVMNLLSNAIKFTPPSGMVTVTVGVGADDRAMLEVRDTGTGIEPALLPRLFEPFMQADRTLDRSAGGLGLGLALVKGLVELHGGEVTATSAGAGHGATFVIRLPLASPMQPVGARPPAVAARRRVLLIEDDPDIADAMRIALEVDAHHVEVVHDGTDALARARTWRPDVVLCDIGLPGLNGYEVARLLRSDATLETTFLVALTGYAQPDDVARARGAGFDQHLAKPADIRLLRQMLADLPRTRRRAGEPLS